MIPERLQKQVRFLLEIDKLKFVLRQTLLLDGQRRENDAEHSWHISLMSLLLAEYAAVPELDRLRVLQMLLVHDLVEIDAGDTFCYDEAGNRDKAQREQAAAARLFALLPQDQGPWVRGLWEEFEARQTPEAKFAAALDRLQPLLHNHQTKGAAWCRHGVTYTQALARNRHIAEGSPRLWELARSLIEDGRTQGWLKDE